MRTPTIPKNRLFALLFALALVAFACGGDDDDAVSATDGGVGDGSSVSGAPSDDGAEPDDADDPYGDENWSLKAGTVDGKDLALLNTHPITFRVDSGEAGGTAACNSYFGALTDGPTLFEGFGATEMACDPPESMELEFTFLDALGRVTDAARDGDELVLTGPDVELTFALEAPKADVDLEGDAWMLDTLIDGDTASSVLADTAPEITFADGQITASDGCNTVSGSYEIDGDTLVVGALRSTTRGCPDSEMNQARSFNSVLASSATISIDGDRLTLTGADGMALVFRAG